MLLHIYRYSNKTRNKFTDILNKLQDRMWIPHQVAYEFHQRRLDVIKEQQDAYNHINDSFLKLKGELERKYSRHPYIEIERIASKIERTRKSIKKLLDKTDEEHPDLIEEDPWLDSITRLFEGRVGDEYGTEKYKELIEEGERRYREKIPPGFKDTIKGGVKQFGDLILWFQIIDKAKADEKPIIFITDDAKNDWWKEFHGRTIGPHPALVQEIKSEANVAFYMYRVDRFIEYAQKYLEEEIDQEAIDEIRQVREERVMAWLDASQYSGELFPRPVSPDWLFPTSSGVTTSSSGTSLASRYDQGTKTFTMTGSADYGDGKGMDVTSPVYPVRFTDSLDQGRFHPVYGTQCQYCGQNLGITKCSRCGRLFCQSCLSIKTDGQGNQLAVCANCLRFTP